jgi:hypothetical protein
MENEEWLFPYVPLVDLVALSSRVLDGAKCFILSDKPVGRGRRVLSEVYYAHSFRPRTYERFLKCGLKFNNQGRK